MADASRPLLKLSYFKVRGRAELTRLVFAAGGVPFEDERVPFEEQKRRKEAGELPFGQFPTLAVDDRLFAQSYSIAKYAARVAGLMPADPLDVLQAEGIVDSTDDVRSKFVAIRYMPLDPNAVQEKYREWFNTTLPVWLEKFERLCRPGQFLVGDSLTVADVAVFNMCDYLMSPSCAQQAASPELCALAAGCLGSFPRLQELRQKVAEVPAIKAWLDKRPQTPHDDVRTLRDAEFN
mmetsp:Transcript_13065/g.35671  ORF Transcript_13065/g.35671 Transcript_13065/m.35671 type:complete len:236 (+) Transcript_13065:53-760(+)